MKKTKNPIATFAKIEFEATEGDIAAAWDMYVELLTRIATQPLEEGTGDETAALKSIYELFKITRDILKEKGRLAPNFTRVAIIVLNQIIRPFTAKWHKKTLEGAFQDFQEENGYENFRSELKTLQEQLVGYAQILANMANVEDLTTINNTED